MLSLQGTCLVSKTSAGRFEPFLHFSLNRVAASVTKALYMYTICLNVRKRGVCWGGGRIKKMSTDRLFSGRVSPV